VQFTDNDFPGYATPMEYEGWNLFWADEFGGNELNLENWTQANSGNWYNNELQYYKPENSVVGNGLLTITAKPEIIANHYYTSSRIWTHHKIFFKYGRIDIRAKLPYSKGLWPALWVMGENRDVVDWAQCGEIDIMELRGHTPNIISSTIHYKNSVGNPQNFPAKKHELSTGDYSDEFHVFSMIWDEYKIQFFVDDNLYNTVFHPKFNYYKNDNPFLKEFYILMNVAIGGNFGGNPDATTIWPQKKDVDYVSIFQKD
jgi:beta-glucanase (GH16 family)